MTQDGLDIVVFETADQVTARAGEFSALVDEALGVKQPLDATLRQINFVNGGTIIVACAIAGELASMNAFMGQRFHDGGHTINGFQSGFSATRNKFRGQGLWPRLLTASEEILAQMGGHWIFGFPNPVSHPLFERKLSYRTIGMYSRRLATAAIPLLPKVASDAAYVAPDLAQLIEWKTMYDRAHYHSLEADGARAIAVKKKKYGLSLLDIGAWESHALGAPQVFSKFARSSGASFVKIEVSETSQFFEPLGFKKPSRPFIVKPIGGKAFPEKINIFGGLSDTF